MTLLKTKVSIICCAPLCVLQANAVDVNQHIKNATSDVAYTKPLLLADNSDKAPGVETVVVTGLKQKGYVQTESSTGTKTDTPIHDTPASIQVISEQLIKDQAVGQSINKLLLNISGISANYGGSTGNLPAVTMRGFDTGGYVMLDGYPQSSGTTYDWSNIDKVEVLKGPASVLYGSQYNIGGQINLITKRPTEIASAEVAFSAGSWNYFRTFIDVNKPLNSDNTILSRFNAAIDTSDSFRDTIYEKNKFISEAFKWKASDNDTISIRADGKRRNYRWDSGLPSHFYGDQANKVECCIDYPTLSRTGRGFDLPINTYIGTDIDKSIDDSEHLVTEWEHKFNEQWKLKIGNSHTWMQYQGVGGYFWWDPTVDADGNLILDSAGNASSTIKVSGFSYKQKSHEKSTVVDLIGHFETYGIKHTFLVGASQSDGFWDVPVGSQQQYITNDPVSTEDWLHHPHYQLIPDPDNSLAKAFGWYQQKEEGIYIQDLFEFNAQWKLLAAYRFGKASGNSFFDVSDGESEPYAIDFSASKGVPRLGVVYEPTDTLSLYTGWSKSFTPNWGRLADFTLPPPEQGEQFEIGLKQDLANGKANINLAIYDIKKTNIEACAPDSPDCKWYILLGGEQSQGIEVDINGEVFENFRVTNAITVQKANVTSDMIYWDGSNVPAGQEMYAVPRWMYNLYGTYTFNKKLEGLEIGGGFNATGRTQANLPNDGLTLAGARTLNLMIGYDFSERVHAQLNINNLTNTMNYSSSGWNLNFGSSPRQTVFDVSWKL